MKPILFNTEMVRALLDGRKVMTRRPVKPQPHTECDHGGQHEFIRDDFIDGISFTGFVCKKCGYGVCGPHFKFPVGTSWLRPPHRPGDILYVRETWQYMGCVSDDSQIADQIVYRADWKGNEPLAWRPSIHMPKEAARLFLRVKSMWVERLQNIDDAQAEAEGAEGDPCDCDGSEVFCSRCCNTGWITSPRSEFSGIWDRTIKPVDRETYGWAANPWVWVIEFERIGGKAHMIWYDKRHWDNILSEKGGQAENE